MARMKRAKLFRNGRNQAVRIPREFELESEEVLVRKRGNTLVIEPVRSLGLLEVLSRLEVVEDEFPNTDLGLGAVEEVNL